MTTLIRRLVPVVAAIALGVAAAPATASADVVPVSAKAATISPTQSVHIARKFAGLSFNTTPLCGLDAYTRAIQAALVPVKVAVGMAGFDALGVPTSLNSLIGRGATSPCVVALQAAKTAAAFYALAVRGAWPTVIVRVDQIRQTGPDLCWGRVGIGTNTGSMVPFDVKYWQPVLRGCSTGVRI